MRRSFLFVLASFALGVSFADADVADNVRRLREQSQLLVGSDAKTLLAQEWTKYDPRTLERREDALRRVRALGKRLADDQNALRSRECSIQIFLEAKWRALYTADFEAIERRIRDLEASLGNDDQDYVAQQSPVDGSWGVCFEPMFMKLEATTLRLQELHQHGTAPNYALNLLPDIRSSKDALARLAPLLVSNIAQDGIDHRSELNGLSDSYSSWVSRPTGRRIWRTRWRGCCAIGTVRESPKFGRTFVSFWMRGRIRSLAIGARGTKSVTAFTGP